MWDHIAPELIHTPLIPAKAGIQLYSTILGPRLREDERAHSA
jgi:hypothetical protein